MSTTIVLTVNVSRMVMDSMLDGRGSIGDASKELESTVIIMAKGISVSEKDKAVAAEATGSQLGLDVIYRLGSGNATNLTPRVVDITGLSYTTVKPKGVPYTTTTKSAINSTGKLIAIQDGPTYVSVLLINVSKMPEWIKSHNDALANPHEYTQILQSISEKGK